MCVSTGKELILQNGSRNEDQDLVVHQKWFFYLGRDVPCCRDARVRRGLPTVWWESVLDIAVMVTWMPYRSDNHSEPLSFVVTRTLTSSPVLRLRAVPLLLSAVPAGSLNHLTTFSFTSWDSA
ncbi:hypothetical protein J6590_003793 [Homalodisca vitripennis]|nr:hypothetical protein J6590_003793 [Homalodisca vitripennis]